MNEGLVMFLFEKWDEMAKKDTYTDRLDATLSKAYRNLCDHKEPIRDLKETNKIKGIGNWTLKLLKEYYKSDEEVYPSSQEASEPTVKKSRGSGRYLPQKGSAPYAILITLYRATQNEKEFMLKQELIDAAEASRLSRMPIGPSKSGAPPGRFGNSFKDWYCGWSSMKTLTSKGLVVKSSCPAKCGCGTIPLEAAEYFSGQVMCLAGDTAQKAVAAAERNSQDLKDSCDVLHWDATRLPLRTGCVDRVICDMPFGVRCGNTNVRQWLCPKVLREMIRVLAPETGLAVLMVQGKFMRKEIEVNQKQFLNLINHLNVQMEGIHVEVFVLQRTSEPIPTLVPSCKIKFDVKKNHKKSGNKHMLKCGNK